MMTQFQIDNYKKVKLTKNFTLYELLKTNHLKELQEPPYDIVKNLRLGAQMLLQPFRNYKGSSVILNSGWRSYLLNVLVKGSKDSDHLKGIAFDIRCYNAKGVNFAYDFFRDYGFYRQLGRYNTFIHVSYNLPGRYFKHQIFDKRTN